MAERKPLVLAPRLSELATGDTLLVPGHVSGVGAAAPTVSAGTVVAGSSDLRGALALPTGVTVVVVTFAYVFASTPFPQVNSSVSGTSAAPTGVTTKTLTIGLSANVGGQTVYWHCLE